MIRRLIILLLIVGCGIFESTSDWVGWSDYYSGKWNKISEIITVSEVENSTNEQISYTVVDSMEIFSEESWDFISFNDFKNTNDEYSDDDYLGNCGIDSSYIKLPNNYSSVDTLNLDSLYADCPNLLNNSVDNSCTKLLNENTVIFIAPDSTEWPLVALNTVNHNAEESIIFPYSIQGLRNIEMYPENIFNSELFIPYFPTYDCLITNEFSRISSDTSLVTIERRCKYKEEYIDSQLYADFEYEFEIYYKWRANCTSIFWSSYLQEEYNDENFQCENYPSYPCEYYSPPLYPKHRYIKHNILIEKDSN